jgi:type I restriction enzyme S subunit
MKENWTYKKFSEVFNLQMGKTPSRDNLAYWGGNNVWVSIADIKDKYIESSKEHITDIAVSESGINKVPKGTAIMSFKLTIGRAAITKCDLFTNEAIMSFEPKEEKAISADYIYYYLKGCKWTGANKAVKGQTLNKKTISENVFSYPSLSEQSRIVSELDLLQSIINKQQAQLKELDKLAQAVFYDMFGDPVENEKGWILKTMEDVCLNIVDCPHSTPKKSNRITNYPCIRTSELKDGSICWDSMQYLEEDEYIIRIARLKPIAGDIVFGREGTIGDAVILPDGYSFSLGQRTMLLRVDSSSISNVFLQRVILSECVKKQIRMVNVSSTVPHVNIKDFKQFEIPVPPLSLQQSFAAKIESIEKQKSAISQSIAETQKLFDYTMDKYFG